MTPNSGCLVVALCGLPGAGKSTLAQYLLEAFALREVNRDRIRAAQFPLCAFSGEEKDAAVQAVKAAVTANCRLGFSSLIDGMTFASHAQREEFRRLAQSEGARFVVLYLDCPTEVARSRLATNEKHPAADRHPALVDEVAGRFETPAETALTLDATLPIEHLRVLALEAISGLLEAARN